MATTEEVGFNQGKAEFETNIINGNENGNSILDNVKNEYDQNNFNNNDHEQNHQEENGNQDDQSENNGHFNEQSNGNGIEQDDNNFMSQGNPQQNFNENDHIDDVNNGQNDDDSNNNGNSQMEPEQFRKVFIGGLSYKTDDETLKNYFSKYGELVDYVVMKDSQSGRSRGFGFVTYSYSSMVDELMKNRPHIIDGRQVEPKRATPREDSGKTEVQMTVKKLFIGGLRDNITEDDLKSYFNNYGNVIEAVVMKEKETNKSRGFGFVTFDDYDPVDKIILEKHHSINGVNVHTQKALPKDFEKNQGNNNNNRGNFRNDNNNFNGNNNYNGGNFNNSNNNNFQRFNNNNFQMQRNNQFQNGNNNSSLNNTYGSYNQAPNKPKMNDGNMNQNNNMMMNSNQMNNRNNKTGGGPMRGGHGRFTNRSSGPYGGGGGFNNGNNNNFNNNRGRIGGRGGIGQRGASQRENNNNNNNNNLSNSNSNMNTMSN